MPLADIAGAVACLVEAGREGGKSLAVGGQPDVVTETAGGGGIGPSLEACTRWAADRLASEGLGDMRASPCQTVEMGHQIQWVAVESGTVPSLLIGQKHDDIGA